MTEKEIIDLQWDNLINDVSTDEASDSIISLIAKARDNAMLQKLFPFLSVGRLCFSRCIDFPYYVDVLVAPLHPSEERYSVEKTIGQGGWADSQQVETVDGVSAAIKLVQSILPSDYGSARMGNADAWRDEFNRTAQTFRVLTPVQDAKLH